MTETVPDKPRTRDRATPADLMPVAHELSADQARRIALRAQGLMGTPDRRAGVPGVLRSLGAVQLDTISVLARSHELIPYARLGPVGRASVESAYWDGSAFEYWSHAACVIPMELWPLYSFRRRAYVARGHRWHRLEDLDGAARKLLDRLRDEGPMTSGDFGGAKKGGPWWDWSESKVAMEWLLDIGEVACVERRGWRRVYDVASRVVPAELLDAAPDDATCLTELVRLAGRALGVATVKDLADYHRLRLAEVRGVLEASGLVPVQVAGWKDPAFADPAALESEPRGRHRTTLLSPFDSLVWDRARTARIFGFTHRLEAYTPKKDRVHGYFAMPLLTGGRLVGRVDPAREGSTLVARRVTLDSARHAEAAARALAEAARWVGCAEVRVEQVVPQEFAPLLHRLSKADEPGPVDLPHR
ncbi:winged helix-turn-helix domain-containing protein [Actinocorallia sp. A-T 12471]|uniref:winged helix-turn-helix domain-containing protein n=1 Tax=Actinocorallia sp. A-T 12471 TaxID=3089813 RepID=UPI0029D03AC9|nr:crosslink repair DNA glycosylase YcaQ family protein [Actinocorallia sp. A-T 12471]MDX6738863.1 crosslink repair DNA glycosylase YcaQ family protein [Actinocorallia sp. A-T 12471]